MSQLFKLSLSILYLFAPLIVSSALAGVALRLGMFTTLRRPLDAKRVFRGRRWFGDNKTWLGVVVAIVGCVATTALQKYIVAERADRIALIDYREVCVIAFGTAMGGGAMLGELPNSFAKRQLGIQPGQTGRGAWALVFYVWDQVDMLTMAWPLLWPWIQPTLQLVAMSFVIALVTHPTVSLIGYIAGARTSAR
jgi:hypothetical protein